MHLSQKVTLDSMYQTKFSVFTSVKGLVVVEPRPDVMEKYKARLGNGVAEVQPKITFRVILSNVITEDKRLPKGMTVGAASKNPLDMVSIASTFVAKIARLIDIWKGYPEEKKDRHEHKNIEKPDTEKNKGTKEENRPKNGKWRCN